MVLTPIDVQQKTFATALRGYDLDEVDDFLDSVVVALKDYDQRLTDAQERITMLQAEVSDRGDAEGAIARALVAAQRSADGILADAREEADRIVSDANNEASELSGEREREQQVLREEISAIQAKIIDVRGAVADLVATIPSTLDEIDSVLEEHSEPAVGATFDAAQPIGGYDIASEDEDMVASSQEDDGFGRHVDSDDSVDPFGSGGVEYVDLDNEDHRGEASTDDGLRETPPAVAIDELSDQIDDAFDEIVSEASDSTGAAHRPWEDD